MTCEYCSSETNGHAIDCPKLNGPEMKQTYYVESGMDLTELMDNVNAWREKDSGLVLVGGIFVFESKMGTIWYQAMLHNSSVRSSGSNDYDGD